MKTTLLITAIIISLWTASIAFTHASEALSGRLIVDFKGETAEYTESHDFSDEYETKSSAHVNRNPCNYCLEYFEPSDCLEVCGVNN